MNNLWIESYRPKTLDDVVGQSHIVKYLKEFIKNDDIPHMLFSGKAGTGKCVVGESIIFVDNSLLTFNEYKNKKTNNMILTENNKNTKGIFYKENINKTIKIVLSDNTEIEGTPEHKIKIFDAEKGIIWKKISSLQKNDIVLLTINQNKFNNKMVKTKLCYQKNKYDTNSYDIPKEITLNEDIAYLIGVIIANGSLSNKYINISTHKKWLQSKIKDIFLTQFNLNAYYSFDKRYNKYTSIRLHSVQLIEYFKKIDLYINKSRKKYVPFSIRKSPKHIQIKFLKGLFDCDSYFNGSYLEYYTASKQLCYMIRSMLLNLGIYNKIKRKYLKKYNHTYYTVFIPSDFTRKVFYLFHNNYKNKYIEFNKVNNTNINCIPKNILRDFIINQLKKYNYSKNGTYQFNKKNTLVEKKYSDIIRLNKNRGISFSLLKKILNKKNGKIKFIDNTLSYLLENNIFLLKIKHITQLNEKKCVYDFYIPKNNTFICNFLINHNTTCAIALAKDLYGKNWKNYFIEINASDETGVETIRTKVKDYARSSVVGEKYKIVFFDEVDYISSNAQACLRRMIEKYGHKCRFIFSCNYPHKIIDPIKDRCVVFRFKGIPTKDMQLMLNEIAEKEDIDITKSATHTLATLSNGSMRKALNTLQKLKLGNKTNINDDDIYETFGYIDDDHVRTLLIAVRKGNIKLVDDYMDNLLNIKVYTPREIVDSLRRLILESKVLSKDDKIKALRSIGDIEFRISAGATPEIQLKTFAVYLINLYEKYGEKE